MNRVVGQKHSQKHSYFTIIPTQLWSDFRSVQHSMIKNLILDYKRRKF
jgi:hypothetical protein